MPDQAEKLRELIHAAPRWSCDAAGGPPLVAVTAGRPGVGATTVAVNLAAVLADRGLRTLLVDAAPQSNLLQVAGVELRASDHSLSDVLAGKCALAEAVVPGPGGTMLLAAPRRVSTKHGCEFSPRRIFDRRNSPPQNVSRHAQQRLLAELASAGDAFDVLVADVGSGLNSWTRRFWLRARLVLLVATAEGTALLDAYAAIKQSVADALGPDVRLLVNQSENERLAHHVQQRFATACCRFLGCKVPAMPSLPHCACRDDATEKIFPRVWEMPDTPFGHAVLWLGRAVSDVVENRSSHRATSASTGSSDAPLACAAGS